jgi:transcriptional regulator with XRE-family HTH domain
MPMTVNEAIRALRKHSGKTQQVFATELGISLRAFQKYEQEQMPEPQALARFIALALDAKLDIIHRNLLNALLKQLAVPGWTVQFEVIKGDATRHRGSSPYRIFRPATPETEIRWRTTEAKS